MLAVPSGPLSAGRNAAQFRLQAAVFALVAAVFVGDVLTPAGYSIWVLYLVAAGIAIFGNQPALPAWIAASCTLLLVVGLQLSPPSDVEFTKLVLNRTSGGVILWFVAAIGWQFIKARQVLNRRAWIQAGETTIAGRMQGGQSIDALGQNILEGLCGYLQAPVGSLYVTDGAGGLTRIASLGLGKGATAPPAYQVGEGLVGRAAAENEILRVGDPAADHLPIESSLGTIRPRELVVVPMASGDEGVALVVELAFVRPVTDEDLELLHLIDEPAAAAVRASLYKLRLQELLAETQRQAEELQAQQEELRAANEELETHARALKDSQDRLAAQHAELEQSNAQLEEQTQALESQRDAVTRAQEELERKATELERVNRYKSEFLANMSHELRTPLNSSLILSKLLADNRGGNLSDEQVKYAQTIYAAGNDLLALINDVLDLAKIEAGKVDLKPADVSIGHLLRDLQATFEPVATDKGLELHVDAAGAPEHVITDRLRLEQILRNLLSNACKFTEKGSVRLQVQMAPGRRVAFSVRDTGIGIAKDQQEVVFEAFRQADGTTSRKYGGTGLGLSISRDLALRLGGELRLESAPGEGSCFTLLLPAGNAKVAETAPAALPAAPAPAVPVRNAAAKRGEVLDDREHLRAGARAVLVIEDDVSFARVLQDLSRELDFQTLVATSADEGMELARTYRPSAIVLDIALPDHSGLAVLDQLKRDATTRHIPVHVVSASDYMQEALAMGAVGYMLKPVKREELVEAFRRLEGQFTERLRKVLVVEDDPRQAESIRTLIGTAGVETVGAAGVAEALEALRRERFDTMVMDLRLADGTGFDLLEKMMEELEGAFPPVIVYTGKELDAQEEERLRRYSSSIIIKGARSPERLLDEVTLFLHQVETSLPPQLQRMLHEVRSRDAFFEGRRILVVEDDIRNVFALSSILEPKGAKVEIARNGLEALAHLGKNEAVDLVLMDIMMPEMDGLQAMEAIRKQPNLAKLPIIALTAKAMADDQAKCLAAGANDYVAKPIDVEKLLSLIRVWMPRRERA